MVPTAFPDRHVLSQLRPRARARLRLDPGSRPSRVRDHFRPTRLNAIPDQTAARRLSGKAAERAVVPPTNLNRPHHSLAKVIHASRACEILLVFYFARARFEGVRMWK